MPANPIVQALLATCFTWGMTSLGAALVFAASAVNRKLLAGMLGFAAGVMIAVSYWSLLAPAVEPAAALGVPLWLPPTVSFLAGQAALAASDRVLPHLHPGLPPASAEGVRFRYRL